MNETTPSEILSLLQTKNRCLDRLMDSTQAFLSAPLETLIMGDEGSETPLTLYENERTSVIQTLEMHDRRIHTLISNIGSTKKTPEFMESVKAELLQNERLITAVFNADDIVFSRIRDAQAQIAKLLQENRKSGDLLSKFKSGAGGTGEGMDKTL